MKNNLQMNQVTYVLFTHSIEIKNYSQTYVVMCVCVFVCIQKYALTFLYGGKWPDDCVQRISFQSLGTVRALILNSISFFSDFA